MAKSLKGKTQDNLQAVEEALSKTEIFLEENQKTILIILAAIVLAFGGYFGYQRFIKLPKVREAQEKMYVAERYFAQDSLNLALNGDGLNPGFLDIIDNYKRTPGGNLSRYYAGAIYLKQGDYAESLRQLKKFKAKDPMVYPTALRMMGDASLELNKPLEAIEYYLKAAEKADNDFLSPEFLMRAGNTYELLKDYQNALDTYIRIRKEYPATYWSNNIEKYISRVEAYIAHGTGK